METVEITIPLPEESIKPLSVEVESSVGLNKEMKKAGPVRPYERQIL